MKNKFGRNEIVKHISIEFDEYSLKQIEDISDAFMKYLFKGFIEEESFQYNSDYPLFKAKRSISKLNDQSPKIQRNDRILVTTKIPLKDKTVRVDKK